MYDMRNHNNQLFCLKPKMRFGSSHFGWPKLAIGWQHIVVAPSHDTTYYIILNAYFLIPTT